MSKTKIRGYFEKKFKNGGPLILKIFKKLKPKLPCSLIFFNFQKTKTKGIKNLSKTNVLAIKG
jgi:hypothetical protein